jgi:lipopolysaccharide export system permease protein
MKILDRYILREFLFSYMVSCVALLSLRIMVDLFVNIDEFTERTTHILPIVGNLLRYYGYQSLVYYQELSGAIILVAATFALARMTRYRETVAVLASGVSLHQLLTPLLLAAVLLNGILLIDQELIIPRVASELVRERDDAPGTKPFVVRLMPDRTGGFLYARQFYPITERLSDVLIVQKEKKTDPETGKTATRAFRISASDADWNPYEGAWELDNAFKTELLGPEAMESGEQVDRTPIKYYHTDLSPQEISLRHSAEWISFLSTRELVQMRSRPYLADRLNVQLQTERHFRFTLPILNIIMVALGAPFFVSREPRSLKHPASACIGLTGLCFIFAFLAHQLSGTVLDPLYAAWLPILIFGPIAIVLLEGLPT